MNERRRSTSLMLVPGGRGLRAHGRCQPWIHGSLPTIGIRSGLTVPGHRDSRWRAAGRPGLSSVGVWAVWQPSHSAVPGNMAMAMASRSGPPPCCALTPRTPQRSATSAGMRPRIPVRCAILPLLPREGERSSVL